MTATSRVATQQSRQEIAGGAAEPQIEYLEAGKEAEWDEFVTAAPQGSIFQLSAWARVVKRVLGHRQYQIIARRGGRVTGVFPISYVRNPILGNCLVSSPLAVYGGICAADEESYHALLRAGSDLARDLGVGYLEMRNRIEAFPSNLPGRDLYVTFTQDLTPGADALLKALPRDTRYAARKGQKAGLTWCEDLTEAEFYEIYAHSVHRLGTPVFSKKLFTALGQEFGKQVRIFGVRKSGKPIAGVLCLYFRDQVLPYYGGSLSEYYRDSPNNFMYWSLIAQSCAEGVKVFDFGRSKRGTGSFEFKSAWSMQVSELQYRYHLVKAKSVPHLSPVDKKFSLPITVWKRMPFSWTKVVGPQVIRWIPSI